MILKSTMAGLLITSASLVLSACGSAPAASSATPDLSAILSPWSQDGHHDLRSVVVMRHGDTLLERYFNGETVDTLHDVRSAGKSVTSLLAAIAVDAGSIRNLSDPVDMYWPAAKGSAIGDVAINDLLTMRSGLAAFDEDPASPGQEDLLDAAPDPLAFALGIPRADAPGSVYRYNSLTAYIAGIVVEKASGRTLADLARVALFEPLGLRNWRWDADAHGHTKGQGNLWLTARGMATLGELVRCQGNYKGARVVSAAGILDALQTRVDISATDRYADGYGHFWYAKALQVGNRRMDVRFASGNGGNKIYVVPSQDLVVSIGSSAYGKSHGQRRSEEILKSILAALPDAPSRAAVGCGHEGSLSSTLPDSK